MVSADGLSAGRKAAGALAILSGGRAFMAGGAGGSGGGTEAATGRDGLSVLPIKLRNSPAIFDFMKLAMMILYLQFQIRHDFSIIRASPVKSVFSLKNVLRLDW